MDHVHATSQSLVLSAYNREYFKAEFRIGPDGKPAALEVNIQEQSAEQSENKILFIKAD